LRKWLAKQGFIDIDHNELRRALLRASLNAWPKRGPSPALLRWLEREGWRYVVVPRGPHNGR